MSPRGIHRLTFHGVGRPAVALAAGEQHVWLETDAFLMALDEIGGRTDVRLSFDDGNRSDVDIVLPALRERGLTATFFVLASRLDDPRHLGPEDLRALVAAGMPVGSHGLHHRDWRRLGDDELHAELADSRRILERAARVRIVEASIPFGSYDRRVLSGLRGEYLRVFSSDGGVAAPRAWLQPRTTVTRGCDVRSLLAPPGGARRGRRRVKRWVKRWR